MNSEAKVLGILGGMGPLATVDFLKKVVEQTNGENDQRHIPTVTWSVPQIPDRSRHIMYGAESPLPQLSRGILQLQSMGASIIAIPCNTAHYWYEQLSDCSDIKILHIVDAVHQQLQSLPIASTSRTERVVGLLATSGAVKSSIYQTRLSTQGWTVVTPDERAQEQIMQGIAFAKAGKTATARAIFLQEIENLKLRGVQTVILGCTEIPSVLDPDALFIDSNLALAKRCVQWFNASYNGDLVIENTAPPKTTLSKTTSATPTITAPTIESLCVPSFT